MTTSAIGRGANKSLRIGGRAGAGGFTLVEMVLTLSIVVLIMGMVLLSTGNLGREARLRGQVQEVSDLVRGTRFRAMTERTPWRIEWHPGRLVSVAAGKEVLGEDGEMEGAQIVRVAKDFEIRVRRSADVPWENLEGQVWSFDPTGVVGTMLIRFDREQAYVEVEADPLTGRLLETGFYLP